MRSQAVLWDNAKIGVSHCISLSDTYIVSSVNDVVGAESHSELAPQLFNLREIKIIKSEYLTMK